jgi:hypothetical protein
MIIEVLRALCEYSILVTQPNQSDQSLKELDNALKRLKQKKGIFRDQKMLTSAKAKVDELLASKFHQLGEQKIYKICTAIEALVYGAEMISTT